MYPYTFSKHSLEEPPGSHRPRAPPGPSPSRKPVGFCLLPFTRGAACGEIATGCRSRARPGLSVSLFGVVAKSGRVQPGHGSGAGTGPARRAAPVEKPESSTRGLISSYCLSIVQGGEINHLPSFAPSSPDCSGETNTVIQSPRVLWCEWL